MVLNFVRRLLYVLLGAEYPTVYTIISETDVTQTKLTSKTISISTFIQESKTEEW